MSAKPHIDFLKVFLNFLDFLATISLIIA